LTGSTRALAFASACISPSVERQTEEVTHFHAVFSGLHVVWRDIEDTRLNAGPCGLTLPRTAFILSRFALFAEGGIG